MGDAAGGYDALSVRETAALYMASGVIGAVLYLLILISYLYVPMIKAQHPAAHIVVWHVLCGLFSCIGFVVAFANEADSTPHNSATFPNQTCSMLAVYNQFWMLAGCMWYLVLTLDLFVALVNPWMGYACKAWTYHTIAWSVSAVAAIVVYQQRLTGISSLNICWIRRTDDPWDINQAQWGLLFGIVISVFVVSLMVLLFASFRFGRRQLDVTYRSKRRILLQYYRYLLVYGGFWTACGSLYYADYHKRFNGMMARRIQIALGLVYGSYPLLLFVAWVLNTELYQHRSSENSMTTAEREAESMSRTEHFSAALRKDLMRYTTAGIRCSIEDELADNSRSPLLTRTRLASIGSNPNGTLSGDEGETAGLYSEKKRLATTVFNGEYRYYEKLGFTDYAPKIFQNIREACGIEKKLYEKSFAGTLLERATEGKSGMLFYFTSDRKYLVKTMTKREHSFLLKMLPMYHQYILSQPNSLLCRFLGCHSMQLPVGWNKMFFVVMENIFADGPVSERYDLKGTFHQAVILSRRADDRNYIARNDRDVCAFDAQDMIEESEDESDLESGTAARGGLRRPETEPLLRRASSRSSLRFDSDFVYRRASLQVKAVTRANLLAQITNDCGFLQELGIMDYSFLLGVQNHSCRVDMSLLVHLAHNAVASEDLTKIYFLGFVDILQHYNLGWKLQHSILSMITDKRTITALPPAEYGLRFLRFIHAHLLSDSDACNKRSYGSVDRTLSSAQQLDDRTGILSA